MARHTVEQRTENIAVDFFSISSHVDIPQILIQIPTVDLLFEVDIGAAVSLVGPNIWHWIATYDIAKDLTFQVW